MSKLPRDVSGQEMTRALQRLGYTFVRQVGSHIRLAPPTPGEPVTVPDHKAIRVGTLESILNKVAKHLGITRNELLRRLKL